MPLVLKGRVKKVIAISSGLADIDLAVKYNLEPSGPYSLSKIALNMAVAKFSAEYAKDGVLFLSVSPGVVETGVYDDSESHGATALRHRVSQTNSDRRA